MTLIYLRHSKHGVKIASLEAEAKNDEAHGWERFVPGAPANPEPQTNALAEPRRRRRVAE